MKTSGPRQRELTTDASLLLNALSPGPTNGVTDPDTTRAVPTDTENKMTTYVGIFECGVRDVMSSSMLLTQVTFLAEKPSGTKPALLYEKLIREGRLRRCNEGISADDQWCLGKLCRMQGMPLLGHVYILALARMLHYHILTCIQFLMANLTPLLMLYLQELDAHGLANAAHTTCSSMPVQRWEWSPEWTRLFAVREELLCCRVRWQNSSRGRNEPRTLRLILARRFVYADKWGSLGRPHT